MISIRRQWQQAIYGEQRLKWWGEESQDAKQDFAHAIPITSFSVAMACTCESEGLGLSACWQIFNRHTPAKIMPLDSVLDTKVHARK